MLRTTHSSERCQFCFSTDSGLTRPVLLVHKRSTSWSPGVSGAVAEAESLEKKALSALATSHASGIAVLGAAARRAA
jgi:hypothetical protein